MDLHQTSVRSRKVAATKDNGGVTRTGESENGDPSKYRKQATAPAPLSTHAMRWKKDGSIMFTLTALALAVRFYKIWQPNQVVFDEVHFGKFAAYYLKREYYFDVHPPFAKILHALGGWLAGFDGKFEFENIGDKYEQFGVPFVKMRALPAIMGSAQVPLLYAIMRETGHGPTIGALSACLLLFDNGHIAQDRLILLDAALTLFMTLSLYTYVLFYKERYNEFSPRWWGWMIATGVNLALTMSCKMVGLLTFMTIGTAVVVDLWNLLDIKRGYTMEHIVKHFLARVVGLIIIPAIVYMFWFWVHFAILIKSGTGDSFMSSEFQESLQGNPMLAQAKELHWGDKITLKHRITEAYLHSHPEQYPLKYDDGRISSQGQQVTGYPHNDTNNIWQLVPPDPLAFEEGDEADRRIRHLDKIRLLHVNSHSFLMTHDVASPLMATNEEFTTWPANDSTRINDTLFEFAIDGQKESSRKAWKSKSTWFRLIHVPTRVSMWTHTETPLPEWGFGQQEINGNKNALDRSALWFAEDLYPDPREFGRVVLERSKKHWLTHQNPSSKVSVDYEERMKPLPPRKVRKMNFLKKFVELQLQMLQQNAHLTQSHPYASSPINWPFTLQGISFWTDNDTLRQIYMVGNPVSWWFTVMCVSVYVGIMAADALARRRGFHPIPPAIRSRMINSVGFFVIAWSFHYLPFFLMNRQLFIHHYLPAHICSCLVAGGVFNFVATETVNSPISRPGPLLGPASPKAGSSPQQAPRTTEISANASTDMDGVVKKRWIPVAYNVLPKPVKASAGAIVGIAIVVFWHLAPLTYGDRGLDAEEVQARKWLHWSLHFAK